MSLTRPTRLDEVDTVAGGLRPMRVESRCGDEEVPSTKAAAFYPDLTPQNIAAVIPAYQAEPWVREVARATAREVERVVVVDDGSTDGTFEAAQLSADNVEVTRHESNLGKGAALRRGFQLLLEDPRVEAVVTLDADGQHVPTEIGKLIGSSSGADLVLGSRSHLFDDMFWLRRVANRASARGISIAAGCRLLDVQTGFRLYRRRLLEQLPLAEDRFEAESAVVVRAARRGYCIRSVSVDLSTVDGRASSHYRPLADSLRIMLGVLAARTLGPVNDTLTGRAKGPKQ